MIAKKLAHAKLPMVNGGGRRRLNEVDKVGVRWLQVLHKSSKLTPLGVGERHVHHHIKGVTREAIRGAERPPLVELRLTQDDRLATI